MGPRCRWGMGKDLCPFSVKWKRPHSSHFCEGRMGMSKGTSLHFVNTPWFGAIFKSLDPDAPIPAPHC